MTKAQKQRFLELKSLGVDMNEAQQDEFDKLAEVAVKAGLDLETLQEVDQSSLTEAELSQVIKGCVQDELFGMSEQIQDRLENSATKEDLERAVKKYASEKINEDELVEKITKSLPKNESFNKEDLAEAFKSAIGSLPLSSDHQYPVQEETKMTIEVPFGNSKGNLTVASKQLHNIMIGKHQDDGITETQLKTARTNSLGRKTLASGGSVDRSGGLSSVGASLTNVDLSTALEEAVYNESALANLMRSQEIQMPTNVFEIPLISARPAFGKVAETKSISVNDPTVNMKVLTSVKFAGRSDYSYELDDDSIIAVLPMLQDQLAKGAADALEESILSAQVRDDAGGGGLAVVVDTFDMGFQRQAEAVATLENVGGTSFSGVVDHIANARGKMGTAGIKAEDLALVLTSKAYGEFVGDTSLITYDKLGDQATLLTGSVGQVFGINVLVSDNFNQTADFNVANGGFNSNGGTAVIVHGILVRPASFKMGVRGQFSVEQDRDITTQTNQVVASFRRAMNVMDTGNAPAIHLVG